eukprot:962545-Pleurochrysis_carterae.AAC.1
MEAAPRLSSICSSSFQLSILRAALAQLTTFTLGSTAALTLALTPLISLCCPSPSHSNLINFLQRNTHISRRNQHSALTQR